MTWGMLFNADKSEWLQLTSKHTAAQDDNRVTVKGQAIPRVKAHNHLGLKVTSTLSWSEHISGTHPNCAQRVGMIRKIRHLLPNHVLKRIYVAQVRSVMEYGCAIRAEIRFQYFRGYRTVSAEKIMSRFHQCKQDSTI